MALGQFLDLVENRYSGVPMSNVTAKAFDVTDPSEPQLDIFADVNGTAFPTPNQAVSDSDGMISFFLQEEAAKIRFYVAGQVIKTIAWYSNRGPIGATGPANSTYALTADLEAGAVANLSAILSEAGKAGTFTIRAYADFSSQVAADTGKINFIRSTADPTKVWVRDSILTDGAARVGTTSGLGVQGDINARPTSATLALSGGAAAIGSAGASNVQADINARPTSAALAATTGAQAVGFQATVNATPETVDARLKALPAGLASYGTAAVDGNVADYSDFLTDQVRSIDSPIDRAVPMPKLHLTSSYTSGKLFNGLPAAVRYNANDYIIVREGTDHVEATTPFTNLSRLVCYVRDVNGVHPTSRTIIYAPSGIDPRDPNILRDGSGNAILVGGKFKVVMFEWAGDYTPGNATAKVWDLDPANLAAGLTSAVSIPAPVVGVKSDIRQLASGTYAFIGYTSASVCYLVTTTNWSTFTLEQIGPGNEAAFCETTEDTTLNVIVRTEEVYDNKCSIFYKRAVSGGAWRVHAVLPYTLNAPTFVKVQNYRVITSYPGGGDGWLLFARDKTGRTGLQALEAPISQLVCFRCKEDYGREINTITDRVVLMGVPQPSAPGLTGDAHYCSVVAGQYSGQLQIYTYGEFITSFDNNSGSSLRVATWRIDAYSDGDLGIRTVKPQRKNLIRNSNFAQGEAGVDGTSANAAVVVDSITGRNVLRITNKITTQIPYVMAECLKGDTLFPKITMKLNSSDLPGSGRHVTLVIRDGVTDAVIQTESPAPNPADFFGVTRTIVCRPVVPTSNRIKMEISTITDVGLTAAESDIYHIELSDDCSRDPIQGDPIPPTIKMNPVGVPVVFGVTAGGASSTATYSAGFWANFGDVKASGIPLEAVDYTKLSVRLENCTTNAGAVLVRCTKCLVNSDGTISAAFTTESGVLTASVECRAIVSIAT